MTSCPQAVEGRFRHEALFYRSDSDLLDVVAPFVEEGLAAGEPTLVALQRDHAALVHSALRGAGITFLPGSSPDTRPATTIKTYQDLFADCVAAGADRIRIIEELPHPGLGATWDEWARYEALINCAYQAFPLWGLCLYDRRTTPPDVVDEVERTHPRLITADGTYVANDRYQDPSSFMAGRPPASPEPIEGEPPALVLLQPEPAVARRAVAELGHGSDVAPTVVDDLIIAVSEVVTNAILHGRAPATLRGWIGPSCIVVTVHDCGQGPADPFVGLVRTDKGGAVGGLGLWIAHQLCQRVTLETDDAGFTVRLVAGSPAQTSCGGAIGEGFPHRRAWRSFTLGPKRRTDPA